MLAIFVNPDIAPGVGAFMDSIGLLMVSVTSATALAEARSQGSLDVLGYTLQRSLVQSLGIASLAPTLTGGRARVRLAQVQARAKLAPAHAQLVETLATAGTDVQSALVQEEPGYQLMSNPAWQSDALTRVTMMWLEEWLDALA